MAFRLCFEITDEHIAEIKEMALRFYCVDLDEKGIKELLAVDAEYAGRVASGDITDTYPREIFGNILTEYLKVPDWPCNGSSYEETAAFTAQFGEAARTKGWLNESQWASFFRDGQII